MDLRTVVRNSVLYRGLRRVRRYVSHSVAAESLADSRVVSAVVLLFVAASVVRVLASDMTAMLKFLSFLLLFLLLVLLVRRVPPLSDR